MSGLLKVARSGVRHRRVASIAVGLAAAMAVTVSVLAGSLLIASSAPFDHAFAAQRGAHLTAQFDAAVVGEAQVAATARTDGVTAAAGPFPTGSGTPTAVSGAKGWPLPSMTLVGRADPGGPVDALTLVGGRWAHGPGELVMNEGVLPLDVGTVLRFDDLPGAPTLTVVGLARSVGASADGWVAPATLPAPTGYQMLYRFAQAATDRQVAADEAAITAPLPPDALAGAQSWLAVRVSAGRSTGVFAPFLAMFGVLGLVLSILIVGNVVAGAVSASTRRIGILKALGCTPAQIVLAYTTQALTPAAAGTVIGLIAGNALAVPILAQAGTLYGTPASGVTPWVDAVVAAGMLGVAAVAGWLSAWRAGRLRTVEALAMGRVTARQRGRWAARAAAALPVPRPVSLGLAHPFARPARAFGLFAAVCFGAVTATYALGLGTTLNNIQAAKNHATADVVVHTYASPYGPHPVGAPAPVVTATPAQIGAAITAQTGTRAYYATAQTRVSVAGISGTVNLYAITGDAGWAGYQMVSGRWFRGPGEAVAVRALMSATGTKVGDTISVLDHGRRVPVRIVGELFDPHIDPELLVDAATVPTLPPDEYQIALRPGTDATAYRTGLDAALQQYHLASNPQDEHSRSGTLVALTSLTVLLTLMLVVVAALGVVNTVVLDTRDRARDIGVCKAIGMTPRQTIGMVLASVVLTGLAAGLIGVPAGVTLYHATAPAIGAAIDLTLPAQDIDVYRAFELLLLIGAGPVIAVLGALLPATWAARSGTATALRSE